MKTEQTETEIYAARMNKEQARDQNIKKTAVACVIGAVVLIGVGIAVSSNSNAPAPEFLPAHIADAPPVVPPEGASATFTPEQYAEAASIIASLPSGECEMYSGMAERAVTYLQDGTALGEALEQETYNAKQDHLNVGKVRAYVKAVYKNPSYKKITPDQAGDIVEKSCS